MSELTMTKSQRMSFLAELHVGVLTIERDRSAPVAVPVWYSYEPGGDVVFSFEATSEKLELVPAGRARPAFASRTRRCPTNTSPWTVR